VTVKIRISTVLSLFSIAVSAAAISISARADEATKPLPSPASLTLASPHFCRPGLFTTAEAARNCELTEIHRQFRAIQIVPHVVAIPNDERQAILNLFREK